MKLIRCVLLLTALVSTASPARGQQPQPVPENTEQQGEFAPAESLPQRERMPAAPLLVGAYAFALVAMFGYLVSVSRRLAAVKTDITRLEAELERGSRG